MNRNKVAKTTAGDPREQARAAMLRSSKQSARTLKKDSTIDDVIEMVKNNPMKMKFMKKKFAVDLLSSYLLDTYKGKTK